MNTIRPRSKKSLKKFIKDEYCVTVPDRHICGGDHSSPFDYLWHAAKGNMGDCIVWANRSGGKSYLAALASLLDMNYSNDFKVRILGGSKDQSAMVYEHYCDLLRMKELDIVKGKILKTRTAFTNGSSINILTQSEKNVRGQHVQRLRCDEIELFDKGVLRAAQFVTQSRKGQRAALEIYSTMHKPYGLMNGQIKRAKNNNVPIYKWCLWEIIEKCVGRTCSMCPLDADCRRKARRANGYFGIDDSIDIMKRSSRSAWETEMLCLRPSLDNVVFDTFNPGIHVKNIEYDPNLPLYRAIDFGFVNPFVCLFVQVDNSGTIRVVDEYVKTRLLVNEHVRNICMLYPLLEQRVAGTYCDPAGAMKNDVTGTSPVKVMRDMGVRVRYRKSGIYEGIEHIRRHLKSGDNTVRLVISDKCRLLIESLTCYHYPDELLSGVELPDKDGIHDHTIDALRYFFVNYYRRLMTGCRAY